MPRTSRAPARCWSVRRARWASKWWSRAMAMVGKRLKKAYEGIDPTTLYDVKEAVKLVKTRAKTKFDETVEIAMNLNVDPRKSDQNLRGTVMLPSGTGKTLRVAVFARGERAKEAEAAGADLV